MTDWTPETLARAFHDAYARAAARAYGSKREPEPWESLSEQARSLMLEAAAGVLGVEVEEERTPPVPAGAMPVPGREEFEAAAETAVGDGAEEQGDWRAEIERQIESITAPKVRAAFKTVREPFRK